MTKGAAVVGSDPQRHIKVYHNQYIQFHYGSVCVCVCVCVSGNNPFRQLSHLSVLIGFPKNVFPLIDRGVIK